MSAINGSSNPFTDRPTTPPNTFKTEATPAAPGRRRGNPDYKSYTTVRKPVGSLPNFDPALSSFNKVKVAS